MAYNTDIMEHAFYLELAKDSLIDAFVITYCAGIGFYNAYTGFYILGDICRNKNSSTS